MTVLEKIVTDIIYEDEIAWDFKAEEERIAKNIANLNFLGELVDNEFFGYMLITMKNVRTGVERAVTEPEAQEFYATGSITGRDDYVTSRALIFYYNLDRNYVRFYVDSVNKAETPRKAYEIAYTRIKEHRNVENAPNIYQRIVTEENKYEYFEPWQQLKQALIYAKHKPIQNEAFYKRIKIDKIRYFDDLNKNMRDSQYSVTGAKYIALPDNFKPKIVDSAHTKIMRGATMTEEFYPEHSIKRFETFKPEIDDMGKPISQERLCQRSRNEMIEYLFSVAVFVNVRPDEFEEQLISGFQETDQAYKWEYELEQRRKEKIEKIETDTGPLTDEEKDAVVLTEDEKKEIVKFHVQVCKTDYGVIVEAVECYNGRYRIISSKLDDNGKLHNKTKLG
jgi:hypothetical protein